MLKNILIIGILVLTQSAWAQVCPTVTLSTVENSNGNYTFTLGIDYTGATYTDHIQTEWNFDDNVVPIIVHNTGTTITHQYYYTSSQTFDPVITVTFQDPILLTTCTQIVSTTLTVPNDLPEIPCPIAAFIPFRQSDACGTGYVLLAWNFCNEDYDGNGDADMYWTADHVEWSMGDGQTVVTQGEDPVTHTYNTSSTVFITATAYFTGLNGESCSVALFDVEGMGGACSLVSDPTLTYTGYLEFDPPHANVGLFINPFVVCEDEIFDVFTTSNIVSGELLPTPPNSADWSYEFFVDGTSVTSGSGLPSSSTSIYQGNLDQGDYSFEIVYTFNNPSYAGPCSISDAILVTVEECEDTCASCNSFKPKVGEKYWVSAWVKEDQASQVKSYLNSYLEINYVGASSSINFYPTGDIIEGWQRVVGSFVIPANTTDIEIKLVATNVSIDVFFDDIRIHPFNASMKSYVYDPETLWLTAELDDNNYATFYEYDKEGQLIRIKKETSRGIMTIQESRSSNPKVN